MEKFLLLLLDAFVEAHALKVFLNLLGIERKFSMSWCHYFKKTQAFSKWETRSEGITLSLLIHTCEMSWLKDFPPVFYCLLINLLSFASMLLLLLRLTTVNISYYKPSKQASNQAQMSERESDRTQAVVFR
jgi:hypothetical protein